MRTALVVIFSKGQSYLENFSVPPTGSVFTLAAILAVANNSFVKIISRLMQRAHCLAKCRYLRNNQQTNRTETCRLHLVYHDADRQTPYE